MLAVLCMAGCFNGCGGGSSASKPIATPPGTVTVGLKNSADKTFSISAEVANTPSERETGLSNRTSLAADAGMLFIFDTAASVSFWMKDTHIPLDMIFISPAGVILSINRNAVPESLTPYTSPTGVKYVLEVNGGYCAANNINTGDKVTIPAGY